MMQKKLLKDNKMRKENTKKKRSWRGESSDHDLEHNANKYTVKHQAAY